MKMVSSNSVSMGSWYRSDTKTSVQDDLRYKFRGLTGCQRDPRKLGHHNLSIYLFLQLALKFPKNINLTSIIP